MSIRLLIRFKILLFLNIILNISLHRILNSNHTSIKIKINNINIQKKKIYKILINNNNN